jgi:hypothetical protein
MHFMSVTLAKVGVSLIARLHKTAYCFTLALLRFVTYSISSTKKDTTLLITDLYNQSFTVL